MHRQSPDCHPRRNDVGSAGDRGNADSLQKYVSAMLILVYDAATHRHSCSHDAVLQSQEVSLSSMGSEGSALRDVTINDLRIGKRVMNECMNDGRGPLLSVKDIGRGMLGMYSVRLARPSDAR